MKATLKERQTLFDLALCECGSVEAAFTLAAINNISLTAPPKELDVPFSMTINKRVVSYYQKRNIQPATGWNNESEGQTTENCAEYVAVRYIDNNYIETRAYGN